MSLKFGILGFLADQPLHAYSVKARAESEPQQLREETYFKLLLAARSRGRDELAG
jgi:hypothetical protein